MNSIPQQPSDPHQASSSDPRFVPALLRAFLKLKGMPQTEMAARLGISIGRLRGILNAVPIKAEMAIRLSRVTGYRAEDLLVAQGHDQLMAEQARRAKPAFAGLAGC